MQRTPKLVFKTLEFGPQERVGEQAGPWLSKEGAPPKARCAANQITSTRRLCEFACRKSLAWHPQTVPVQLGKGAMKPSQRAGMTP